MGTGHAQPAPQNPRGLRHLPRPHPHRTKPHAHNVITGEPDDMGNRHVRFGGRPRGKGPATRLAPRRVVDPTGWLMRYRRLCRNYEHCNTNAEAMIWWANSMIMTRRLARINH